MYSLDFTGKTALVVGGSSGIGNGIAQAFRQQGATVHIWGTRPTPDDYSADEGSGLQGLHYAQVDVSDRDAIERYAPPFDALDILVLSQGTAIYKRGEFERAGWDEVMAINLDSLHACAMKFHDHLAAARGALIIVSSVAGFRANKGNPAYNASKHGAVGLTRSLAAAWAAEGITVNGVAPGFVETKLTRVTMDNPKRREGALAAIPNQRFGTPEDMAGAALFLASPLADYVQGQTLLVDGGLSLS